MCVCLQELKLSSRLHLFNQQYVATTVFIDSQSTLAVVRNLVFHARTKHIEVYYRYVKERLSTGEIILVYVPTQDNLAYLFTKALPREKFEAFRKALGLLPLWIGRSPYRLALPYT